MKMSLYHVFVRNVADLTSLWRTQQSATVAMYPMVILEIHEQLTTGYSAASAAFGCMKRAPNAMVFLMIQTTCANSVYKQRLQLLLEAQAIDLVLFRVVL